MVLVPDFILVPTPWASHPNSLAQEIGGILGGGRSTLVFLPLDPQLSVDLGTLGAGPVCTGRCSLTYL
eukprot:15359358-Ditylum_brightwellii.AAC.1